MPAYQGHRSWNAWNVSLWLNNDESLYRWARDLAREHGAQRGAARLAIALAGERTPDGARYNLTCIREAMRGILD
jgi:hypothetical protein